MVVSPKVISPAQVTKACVLNKYDSMIPIGMRKRSRKRENLGTAQVSLIAKLK